MLCTTPERRGPATPRAVPTPTIQQKSAQDAAWQRRTCCHAARLPCPTTGEWRRPPTRQHKSLRPAEPTGAVTGAYRNYNVARPEWQVGPPHPASTHTHTQRSGDHSTPAGALLGAISPDITSRNMRACEAGGAAGAAPTAHVGWEQAHGSHNDHHNTSVSHRTAPPGSP